MEHCCCTVGAEEPVLPARRPTPRPRRDDRTVDDLPAAVVTGAGSAIVLVLVGAPLVGLAPRADGWCTADL
jgi:hypothetical protein